MTKKVKPVETMTATYEQYTDMDFIFPSRYMFRDALGNYVFILTNKREIANKYLQDTYNGFYSLREV